SVDAAKAQQKNVVMNDKSRPTRKPKGTTGGALVTYCNNLIPSLYRRGEEEIDRVTVFPLSPSQCAKR
ncbi:hypothetical protein PFISCL1PPCAC_3914, partial [Pristionchus fissidentatus]